MAVPVSVPIDQRFAQLIQQFGLTKNSFAISLGKTASVVQHLIDGRNKPGYDLLCKVFEIYPNVSRDWLLLGRGPMLVSGEHAPKAVTPPAAPLASVAPEAAFEPIDLSDVEVHAARRSGPGVAGSRLQPAEIAATLALAAAANQPVRANGASALGEAEVPQPAAAPAAPVVAENPVATHVAAAAEAPAAPVAPAAPGAPLIQEPVPVLAAPHPTPAPAPAVPAPAPSASAPEVYVAAALHAQHLQHQLALAEMRNQHLLEQQNMLREMLAMARQSMV
ncbi:helix-turn-helix transcriptional regulator [Hymenobacter siberiensis]|uniref:helix-turn-helix transcriptional regulator n=1 Tax=Hymenobacter siberiensis TaxID=2848396 RepID=UPI001C1E275C|nr:helix-turn-helix transcriptional regulator [Hymenobacter siberiensis]